MNKITFREVEERFKEVYKDGNISLDSKYRVKVNFVKYGKTYIYNVRNYAQLFNSLKLGTVMYERDYNNILRRIRENESLLDRGYYETEDDFFGLSERIYLTNETRKNLETELEYFYKQVENIVII